jgi:hypothetical protein
MTSSVDLLLTGFCTVFDEPSQDGRPAERREDYDWFPEFADTCQCGSTIFR